MTQPTAQTMRVKICGINSESAFDTSVEAGADLLGFVFFSRSPRFVAPRQAAALSNRHAGGPLRVGLFVNPTEADVRTVLDAMHLDKLQIYAPLQTCQTLREKLKIKVAHAIGVDHSSELPDAANDIDCLLIESKAPATAARPGGNATIMDWSICKDWAAPLPWLLAGGLTAENVATAISRSGASGVDVSSGVESLPGVKSPALIRRFIANAHAGGVGLGG